MTVVDQAQRLRELVADDTRRPGSAAHDMLAAHESTAPSSVVRMLEPVARANVLAIASGKGGVGKSNVAVNLSVRLAEMGRRVALVDLDMGLANADVLCGLNRPYNLSHVISGRRRLEDVTLTAPGGFRLVPGASGVSELADMDDKRRDRLIKELCRLEASCDVLVLDISAGISSSVLAFATVADTVLVVTTPEPTAVTDAYGLIKSIVRRDCRSSIALIVNQVESEAQGRRVFERMAVVCRRFLERELQYAGAIPFDTAVRRAVQRQKPFTLVSPTCGASRAVTRLCHTLERSVSESVAARGRGSNGGGYFIRWFKRVMPAGSS